MAFQQSDDVTGGLAAAAGWSSSSKAAPVSRLSGLWIVADRIVRPLAVIARAVGAGVGTESFDHRATLGATIERWLRAIP
jgi:hypothetical protein